MDEEVGTPGGNCSTSGTNVRSIFKYELIIDHWSKAGVAAGNFWAITQMLTLTR